MEESDKNSATAGPMGTFIGNCGDIGYVMDMIFARKFIHTSIWQSLLMI